MLKLFGTPIIASFCRVSSGAELDLYSSIQSKSPSSVLFKALGEFDLVVFDGESLTEIPTSLSESTGSISSCRKVSTQKIETIGYKTPGLLDWLKEGNIVGFILLELNKWIYTYEQPSNVIGNFLQYFNADPKWDPEETVFVAGFGQSEIYALVRSDNFDELFKFANYLRSVRYENIFGDRNTLPSELEKSSVFSTTHTVPLISYSKIIKQKCYSNIKGNVEAEILVRCPPGLESEVCNMLSFPQSAVSSILGVSDFSVRIKKPVGSDLLIETLMKFRSKWKRLNTNLIDTSTCLYGNSEFSPASGGSYTHENVEEYLNPEQEFERLRQFICSRIVSLSHRVRSHLNTRSSMPAVLSLACIPPRIHGESLRFLVNQGKNLESDFSPESTIISMLDSAEIALAQRTASSFVAGNSASFLPEAFGDGVLSAIFAIEAYVSHVYSVFYSTYSDLISEIIYREDDQNTLLNELGIDIDTDDEESSALEKHCSSKTTWKGYVYFSDTEGFQYHYYDVFSLPLEAVSSPAGEGVNWLTLTHEISHSIFTILNVDKKRSDVIQESVKRVLGSAISSLEVKEFGKIRDFHFELFANWFDYYHFYNADIDFYFECIWSSWATVPVVYSDVTEYVFRSFMIYVLKDNSVYQKEILLGREKEYLDKVWSEYCDFMEPYISILSIKHVVSQDYEAVMELVSVFGGPFSTIVDEYTNDDFRIAVNETYIDLDSHLDRVLKGEVVDEKIINPFIFLLHCRKMVPTLELEQRTVASSAIIFSLRNSAKFIKD
ncbi:MAG: hypothetical protein JAZ12_15395 [Candidatus Thiodiazotropha taylori]|nr:hypothetical protein [Candidatus Thiodiazotropha taylori]